MPFRISTVHGRKVVDVSKVEALQIMIDLLDLGAPAASVECLTSGERWSFTRDERAAVRRAYGLTHRTKRPDTLPAVPGAQAPVLTGAPVRRRAWRGVFGVKPHETRVKYA